MGEILGKLMTSRVASAYLGEFGIELTYFFLLELTGESVGGFLKLKNIEFFCCKLSQYSFQAPCCKLEPTFGLLDIVLINNY